jgi:hypothetical protein
VVLSRGPLPSVFPSTPGSVSAAENSSCGLRKMLLSLRGFCVCTTWTMEGCNSVVVGDGGEAALSRSKLEPSSQDDDCWEESTLREEPTLATDRTRNKPTPRRGPVRDMVQQFS